MTAPAQIQLDAKHVPSPTNQYWTALALIILLLGSALRLTEYLRVPSLSHDDACLAYNILHRSLGDLLRPLDYDQVAPFGFLALERLAVVLFGGSELALRLVPLLFSIASLFLLAHVLRRILSGLSYVFAIACLSFSQALIVASGWVKQYTGEVFFTIVMFECTLRLFDRNVTRAAVLRCSALLALLLWLSFPGLFLLAGLIGASVLRGIWTKDFAALRSHIPLYAITGVSAALFGLYAKAQSAGMSTIMSLWPSSVVTVNEPSVAFQRIQNALTDLGQFTTTGRLAEAAVVLILIGFVGLFKRLRWPMIAILLGFCACVAASAMGKYPLVHRMLFYLVPVTAMCAGEAIAMGLRSLQPPYTRLVTTLAALALAFALGSAINHRILRDSPDDPRGLLGEVRRHWVAGDKIYLSPAAAPSFEYYRDRLGFAPTDGMTHRTPQARPADLQRALPVQPGRLWFMYFALEREVDTKTLTKFGFRGTKLTELHSNAYGASLWEIQRQP